MFMKFDLTRLTAAEGSAKNGATASILLPYPILIGCLRDGSGSHQPGAGLACWPSSSIASGGRNRNVPATGSWKDETHEMPQLFK
jgi:hypothetical protein